MLIDISSMKRLSPKKGTAKFKKWNGLPVILELFYFDKINQRRWLFLILKQRDGTWTTNIFKFIHHKINVRGIIQREKVARATLKKSYTTKSRKLAFKRLNSYIQKKGIK